MNDNILDVTHKHGEEMYILGLKHSLAMAKLYRDFDDKAIDHLIKHVEDRIVEKSRPEHSRFDESHYKNCEDCYRDHLDFIQDQEVDNREA